MRKETILRLTVTREFNRLDHILKFLTEHARTKVLERTKFNIQYSCFGGWYQLDIRCYSKCDSQHIKYLLKNMSFIQETAKI